MTHNNFIQRELFKLSNFINLASFLFVMVLAGCGTTTVILSNFRDDAIGSPPGPTQPTGTLTVHQGNGTVLVVAAPISGMPNNKWAHLSHPASPTGGEETFFTSHFSHSFDPGNYSMACAMVVSAGAGIVTVQFESETPQGAVFFHLDFMPEGDVRIDDGTTRFGHFPRNASFVLNVTFNTKTANPTAEVTLLGGSASGNITTTIQPVLVPIARRFQAVTFRGAFQNETTFFVDDVLVTRKN